MKKAGFVKEVLRENRIPFEIAPAPDPFFSECNIAYVKKSVQELKAGKGTAHELIEAEDECENVVWHSRRINEKERLSTSWRAINSGILCAALTLAATPFKSRLLPTNIFI